MCHQLAYCAACASIPRRKLCGETAVSIITIQLNQHHLKTVSTKTKHCNLYRERVCCRTVVVSECLCSIGVFILQCVPLTTRGQHFHSTYKRKLYRRFVVAGSSSVLLLRGVFLENIISLQEYVIAKVREHVAVFIIHFTHKLAKQLQARHPRQKLFFRHWSNFEVTSETSKIPIKVCFSLYGCKSNT